MELSEREQRIQEICAEWRRFYHHDFEEMMNPADDDEPSSDKPWIDKGDRLLLDLVDLDAFLTAVEMVMKEGHVETDLYGFIQVLVMAGHVALAHRAADRIPPTEIDTLVRARLWIALVNMDYSDIALLRLLVEQEGADEVVIVEGRVGLWLLTSDERDLQSVRRYTSGLSNGLNKRSMGFLRIAQETGASEDFIAVAASLDSGTQPTGSTKESLAIICAHELSRCQDMRATVRAKIVSRMQTIDREFGDMVFTHLREAHFI